MFFSIITKNLNWGILTKNLVIFKRWNGVKDEKFRYYGGSMKNPIFRAGPQKNQYIEGNCLKRGAWTVCRFKWGLAKKSRVGFLRGVDIPMQIMYTRYPHTFELPHLWALLPFLIRLPSLKLTTLSLYQSSFINNNIVNKIKCMYRFNYKIVIDSQTAAMLTKL